MKKSLTYILIAASLMMMTPGTMTVFAIDANPINNGPAQYTALEPLPCIPGGNVKCAENGALQSKFDFSNYVQYIFNLIIALAAAAAVFMIVYGGFQYMTTDSWNGKSAGVEKLKNALLGLLLILTSYLILRTIDPRLVAIPSTLVQPLNINYSKLSTEQMLNQLTSLADKALQDASVDATQATAARNMLQQDQQNAKSAASDVLGVIRAAQAKYNPNTPSILLTEDQLDTTCRGLISGSTAVKANWNQGPEGPQIIGLCQGYFSLVDKTKTDTTDLYVSSVKNSIDKNISDCVKNNVDVNDCATNIDVATQQGVRTLVNDLSANPQVIYDYKQYANGVINAAVYGRKWAGDKLAPSDYGQIISVSQQYLDQIKDPSIQAKLIQNRDQVITKLGGSQQSIDDGTYLKAYKGQSTYTPSI